MSTHSSQKALRAFLALSSAMALMPGAIAQTDHEDDEDQETITVYETSNQLPVFDYPWQVKVVDREALETYAPSAISDALCDVPELDFAGGPRRTGELPSIRGLSGQNVLILLDGARQIFTSAHDERFFVDPELIGRAEGARGPASALYGSVFDVGVDNLSDEDYDRTFAGTSEPGQNFKIAASWQFGR